MKYIINLSGQWNKKLFQDEIAGGFGEYNSGVNLEGIVSIIHKKIFGIGFSLENYEIFYRNFRMGL